MKLVYNKSFLFFLLVLFCGSFAFAQAEREKGIELFKQGKNKEAVAALEQTTKKTKTDAEIWNYLGLAYIKINSLKKAVKAIEKAVSLNPQSAIYQTNLAYAYLLSNKLGKARDESTKAITLNPQSADAYYVRGSAAILEAKYDEAISDADRAIAANADYASAYILKSDALLSKFGRGIGVNLKPVENSKWLIQAKEVLENCLKNCKNNSQVRIQQERLEAVNAFYDYYEKRKNTDLALPAAVPTVPNPNITPLRIVSKPKASYTDKAREAQVSGTIIVLVLFAGSGRVTHTIILEGLGYGLNENAVNAARKIVFEPAKENGKPISQIKIVQYSFKIY